MMYKVMGLVRFCYFFFRFSRFFFCCTSPLVLSFALDIGRATRIYGTNFIFYRKNI
ncbi:hypothetical protein BCV72DRAFT_125147 [Rhizopus microsporus var. microsporus]|uniref:Uncharacterized protein n=1 Tax=Rhizopus microsporus var. microsporus TaxID=86635 RepID=A0A1X0R2Y3_RHIZD|nr:hypothetical protein BCV72DRAFT_125147 [Rhizopus microsporus var. microsporus]